MDNIITGQHITPTKKVRSRELRQKMTPEEKILWYYLRKNNTGFHFRRQQVIDGFIVDFYYHEARLF